MVVLGGSLGSVSQAETLSALLQAVGHIFVIGWSSATRVSGWMGHIFDDDSSLTLLLASTGIQATRPVFCRWK
jgi:hypothetical protein